MHVLVFERKITPRLQMWSVLKIEFKSYTYGHHLIKQTLQLQLIISDKISDVIEIIKKILTKLATLNVHSHS